jgi:hypothetical protein
VASLLASSSAWAYDTVGHLPSADEARAGSEAAQLALARASGAPSAFALELPTLFSALATASPCQAEYAEDAQGQPLVHAATHSEHTHTLEAQLRSVHRETADLEAQLLGLSGALMLCESDLCASLSAGRDSQRMVGAARVVREGEERGDMVGEDVKEGEWEGERVTEEEGVPVPEVEGEREVERVTVGVVEREGDREAEGQRVGDVLPEGERVGRADLLPEREAVEHTVTEAERDGERVREGEWVVGREPMAA